MKDHIAHAIAAVSMETLITPESLTQVRAIYTSHHEHEPYASITVTRDQSYGAHPRQRLDIFAPSASAQPLPVVLFVHGGGFTGGERRTPDTPYYDNIGIWAVRNGFVGVTISYRLAPEFKFPAGPDDVAGAVAFLKQHISAFGGDPNAIVLLGQSAGSSHAANYGALYGARHDVRGIAMMSGVYDFEEFGDNPVSRAYLGDDPATKAKASSIAGLVASKLPLLISISEFDPEFFHKQAWLLAQALFARDNRIPNLLYLPRHNHLSQIMHLNAQGIDDRLLGDRLAEFVHVNSTVPLTVRA